MLKLYAWSLLCAWAIVSVKGGSLDEKFGYVEVRKNAHMFWVFYQTELPGDVSKHPLILWLQGGPGASGVGFGNFVEIGPHDINGNLRKGRWTKKASLMFVDNPVGTGYSYVKSFNDLSKNNSQIARDLVNLLKSVFESEKAMQTMPFYIFAESYGGKMTADTALLLNQEIKMGNINCNFKGVALGDSWISPMDSVNTWAPFLYSMGIVNQNDRNKIAAYAEKTQRAVNSKNWSKATKYWESTEYIVMVVTDDVSFYNVLAKDASAYEGSKSHFMGSLYSKDRNNSSFRQFGAWKRRDLRRKLKFYGLESSSELTEYMNSVEQKKRWKIPEFVTWYGQAGTVFDALSVDFMKPVVLSVSEILNDTNLNVVVYSGSLDLICDTIGTYRWIENMNYNQKEQFERKEREALYVNSYPAVAAYVQRVPRFSLYTILRAGHMVPVDAPEITLKMVEMITKQN